MKKEDVFWKIYKSQTIIYLQEKKRCLRKKNDVGKRFWPQYQENRIY